MSDVAVAFIAILLLIMTFVYAWMVLRNFGRGLKDQSTSTSTFLALLDLTLVPQSHANKRLVQSAAHTRRYLGGLTG